jgi:aminoacyl tRNA synthase complex-interacting multifunctional protein 1
LKIVGEITEMKTIEGSSNLFACEVDIGNDETRHIVTAARKFYTISKLTNKKVCVFANCQSGELFDHISQRILLGCATDDNHVELLEPPEEASAGDRIYFGSFSDEEAEGIGQNNRHWKRMQQFLKVDSQGNATYRDEEIYTDYGTVTAPNLRDCEFH